MDTLKQVIEFLSKDTSSKVLWSVFIILAVWIIKRIMVRVIDKNVTDIHSSYSWKKTVVYTLTFTAIFIVGRIWFVGFQHLATFLGLLTAGIAIALKDLIANLAGWLFIVWRRPFEVGNRIQIGDKAGDVIDLRPFQFTLLEIGNWVNADQSTGRIIHMPNNFIFTQPVCNYDTGFRYIWNEIPVLITFESDWKKTKQLLLNIANENALPITDEVTKEIKNAAKKFMIFYNKVTPVVYTSVIESGVLLTVRYLIDIRRRRGSTEAIWEGILNEFAKHDDVTLAYPTYRIMSDQVKDQHNPEIL
ncbi:MAG: mechanosensitive ion channel [Candidatus Cloacimonadaceae bacterium]